MTWRKEIERKEREKGGKKTGRKRRGQNEIKRVGDKRRKKDMDKQTASNEFTTNTLVYLLGENVNLTMRESRFDSFLE